MISKCLPVLNCSVAQTLVKKRFGPDDLWASFGSEICVAIALVVAANYNHCFKIMNQLMGRHEGDLNLDCSPFSHFTWYLVFL